MTDRRWLGVAVAALLSAVALRAFVLGVVRVRTGSMEPTVAEGEIRVWSRLATPTVGDVVVVRLPDEPDVVHVKRLVAVGPAEVELVQGRLYVDGVGLGEEAEPLEWQDASCRPRRAESVRERVGDTSWRVVAAGDHDREILHAGEVWLLGDARRTSHDSRQWGPLPAAAIEGVLTGVAWTPGACEG